MEDLFLSMLDGTGLKRMQILCSTARAILWVSRGARLLNPEANMFTGFARYLW